MNLFIGRKVGVSREERALPYFKFFERDMAKVPDEKLALVEKPSALEAVAFK